MTLSQSLAILFALLTAVTNAIAVTTQHIASTRKQDHASNWRLTIFLFRQPLWLLGWVALFGSLIFQALALHFGPMSEVQPLLVVELIVVLVLRRFWIHQGIRRLAWISAGVTVIRTGAVSRREFTSRARQRTPELSLDCPGTRHSGCDDRATQRGAGWIAEPPRRFLRRRDPA